MSTENPTGSVRAGRSITGKTNVGAVIKVPTAEKYDVIITARVHDTGNNDSGKFEYEYNRDDAINVLFEKMRNDEPMSVLLNEDLMDMPTPVLNSGWWPCKNMSAPVVTIYNFMDMEFIDITGFYISLRIYDDGTIETGWLS